MRLSTVDSHHRQVPLTGTIDYGMSLSTIERSWLLSFTEAMISRSFPPQVGKDGARLASDEGDVYKVTIAEAESWETPRPPFEVCMPAMGCLTGCKLHVCALAARAMSFGRLQARDDCASAYTDVCLIHSQSPFIPSAQPMYLFMYV